MRCTQPTTIIHHDDYPFEDVTDEVIDDPPPPTKRYNEVFDLEDEVTIFNFAGAIVL
jgi:hypothetical protein